MRQSLEIRVPMLDEDLFAFGLSLPHRLKVKGRQCKRVLRSVAARRLPEDVARKPKLGFGIPVDTWVDADFKQLKTTLLGASSRLPRILRAQRLRAHDQRLLQWGRLSRCFTRGFYQRAIMLLAVHVALS